MDRRLPGVLRFFKRLALILFLLVSLLGIFQLTFAPASFLSVRTEYIGFLPLACLLKDLRRLSFGKALFLGIMIVYLPAEYFYLLRIEALYFSMLGWLLITSISLATYLLLLNKIPD